MYQKARKACPLQVIIYWKEYILFLRCKNRKHKNVTKCDKMITKNVCLSCVWHIHVCHACDVDMIDQRNFKLKTHRKEMFEENQNVYIFWISNWKRIENIFFFLIFEKFQNFKNLNIPPPPKIQNFQQQKISKNIFFFKNLILLKFFQKNQISRNFENTKKPKIPKAKNKILKITTNTPTKSNTKF